MTQGELEKLPAEIVKQMNMLQIRIMDDIVRRIRINGFSTASADWQISRLQQLGMAEEDIRKWIRQALDTTEEEVDRIFSDEVYEQYMGHARAYNAHGQPFIPFKDNDELQQTLEAIKAQTMEEFRNMTGSLGFVTTDPARRLRSFSLSDYYVKTLDEAIMDIHSGAFDYNTVLRRTINEMTASGLRWIDYESGWHNRVPVAARRAVMTGFRQVQGKINEQVARDLHLDTYEVTVHIGARPTHQPWEGKVWTMEQLRTVCGLGTVTGLHGANCYHDYNAFDPEFDVRTYSDEELERIHAEENTPKTYMGKEYTTYEALQRQRQLETRARKYREDVHLLEQGMEGVSEEEAAKIKDTITLTKARYQGTLQEYQAFSKKMDLPMQKERIYQDGLKVDIPERDLSKVASAKPKAKAPEIKAPKIEPAAASAFTPAKTIEEAQEYAQQYIQKNFMDFTFKGQAIFKGISLEHANAINEALTNVYDQFPDLEKLSGIRVVSPKTAAGKKAFPGGADALFSYDPIQHGININGAVLKDSKTLQAYMDRSKDAWNTVMGNLDKLSGRQRAMAERYLKAGRELVDGDTVQGLFTHEMGHHVQWTMLDPKTTNSLGSRMSEFSGKISGYATSSKSEYFAESFAAYMKGERDILDPEYVKFLDAKIKPSSRVTLTRGPEFARTFKAVHEEQVVNVLRQEYDPWIKGLTGKETHAIRKYTKNSFDDEKPKFYERLNAMLRGDIPEDAVLREYADTISGALGKHPLKNDIICHRRTNINPFEGLGRGDVKTLPQFISSSVVNSRALKGEYEITIFARKGTRGAYIDAISRFPKQREFLIDKDSVYRIIQVKDKHIVVEVI